MPQFFYKIKNISKGMIHKDTTESKLCEDTECEDDFDFLLFDDHAQYLVKEEFAAAEGYDQQPEVWLQQHHRKKRGRQSRSTVLRRPNGDDFVETLQNAIVQLHEKYDVLCLDMRYYVCEVIEVFVENSTEHVKLHFPGWSNSFDFTGSAGDLYLSNHGSKTIPAGLNVRSNRFKILKNSHSWIFSSKFPRLATMYLYRAGIL